MSDNTANGNFIELTAEIVSAYVSNNTVPAGEISGLINQVHAALSRVSGKAAEGPAEPLKPAVSVKKSITPEFIVCLEDGKKFKKNGGWAPTTPWWRQTTRPPDRNSPNKWDWGSNAGGVRNKVRGAPADAAGGGG